MDIVNERTYYYVQVHNGNKWNDVRVLNEDGINGFKTKSMGLRYLEIERSKGVEARLVKYQSQVTMEVLSD